MCVLCARERVREMEKYNVTELVCTNLSVSATVYMNEQASSYLLSPFPIISTMQVHNKK